MSVLLAAGALSLSKGACRCLPCTRRLLLAACRT